MSTPRSDCAPTSQRRPTRDGSTGEPSLRCRAAAFTTGALVIAAVMLSAAPTSTADPPANLQSMVQTARGGCGPLQPDPVLDSAAERANRETLQYQLHGARFEPFEDPLPLLRSLGFQTGKAKMLSGFGDVESEAMEGVVLFGWDAIPDCSFTRFGVHVLDGDGTAFATAILAAP